MAEVISRPNVEEVDEYDLVFDYVGHDGWGFSFPCDEHGNVKNDEFTPLYPEAERNLNECLAGTNGTEPKGVRHRTRTIRNPMVIRCACGEEVWLYDDTKCECGRMYNTAGQEILYMDRAGFEALGGESYCGEHWGEDDY